MRPHFVSGLLLATLLQASEVHAEAGSRAASDQVESSASEERSPENRGQAPLNERLYMLSQANGRGDYISAPVDSGKNTLVAWSWSISTYLAGPAKIDAFLNEYDCATSQFRRLRQERYNAETLYDTREDSAGFRPSSWMEMESRIVNEICNGTYARLPQIENVSAAIDDLMEIH